jgi:uncharacterized protein
VIEWSSIVAGALVGVVVGATGVGGGSLMTPLLMLGMNVPAALAVGTDLLFAAITKAGGVIPHQRQRNIDWPIVRALALGSVPAAIATLAATHYGLRDKAAFAAIIQTALGVALLLTALAVTWRLLSKHRPAGAHNPRPYWQLTFAGAVVGVLVALTSVGAGAVVAALLMLLYPTLTGREIAGTDIAHAVPLTWVAGLGHAVLGHVDYGLLGSLLLGSLPGIWFGSLLAAKLPERVIRATLAALLAFAGVKLVA